MCETGASRLVVAREGLTASAGHAREAGLAAAADPARKTGLPADDLRVLSNRGNLLVHLGPAPVVARVATMTARTRRDPNKS